MTIQIKHAFTSAKGDGGDATLVRPSNWNATHTTSMASGNILGRTTAGAGSFEELPATAYMIAALNAADKAALVAALGIGVFDTGDIKFSANPTASDGWIAYNGEGTISKAAAGGTVRANADCLELWKILYVNITDAFCPVSGGRTGSDATSATNDFNAGKTMGLPRFSGRAIIGAGTGSTLTARAAGAYGGAETHTLSTAELAAHQHDVFLKDPGHSHSYQAAVNAGLYGPISLNDRFPVQSLTTGVSTTGITIGSVNGTANDNKTAANAGGGGAHNNMQPHVAMWVKVKL